MSELSEVTVLPIQAKTTTQDIPGQSHDIYERSYGAHGICTSANLCVHCRTWQGAILGTVIKMGVIYFQTRN